MANFMTCNDNFKISIPRWQNASQYTVYEIEVKISDVYWTVFHRYSDFVKLHDTLVSDHGVTADIFPPKKVLGNRDESFIEKRRQSLEAYLSTIVRYLQKAMPKILTVFLKFDAFEINFIVRELAFKFFTDGEKILRKTKHYEFTPLEIYSIGERLKRPCSSQELDQREDLSHILDFCCHLTEVSITGSDVSIPNSNIIPNTLPLKLNVFKILDHLIVNNFDVNQVVDVGSLRLTLRKLTVNNSLNMKSLDCLFQCDQIHKSSLNQQNEWVAIAAISVSGTSITNVDEAILLVPNVTNVSLENNCLVDITNLQSLSKLTRLSLRNNQISLLDTIELKLDHLASLDLSQNLVCALQPFSKLLCLEVLVLQSNQIKDIEEVRFISGLPCLENLVLSGNPLSIVVDYRVKVLAMFGARAFRICLDNESTDRRELDRVAILSALRASKQGLPYVSVSP